MRHQLTVHLIFLLSIILLTACGGGGSGGGGGGPTPPGGNSGGGLAPSISIADASIAEGDSATGSLSLVFPLTLSAAINADVSIEFETSNGSAIDGEDYVATNGSITISAGDTNGEIVVEQIGETCFESDETFTITLSNPSQNATISKGTATGTIINNDKPVQVSVQDASVVEGDSGQQDLVFSFQLDRAACDHITFYIATNDVTANTGDDYVASAGLFTIIAGLNGETFEVEVNGDNDFEIDETLTVNLSNFSANAEGARSEAFGTIENDDFPRLSLAGGSVTEGNSDTTAVQFTASLEAIASSDVSFNFGTQDRTATIADNDYVANSGTLTIPQGQEDVSFNVVVNGDTNIESNEDFNVQLSNLNGDAVFFINNAEGTIIDDDSAPPIENPEIVVRSASFVEGDTGTSLIRFFVEVFPVPIDEAISFDYDTADQTPLSAEGGVDYIGASGRFTLPAQTLDGFINVEIIGDTIEEEDETFNLILGGITANATLRNVTVEGRISDDDGPLGPPRLSVNNASVLEGNSGERQIDFTLILSAESSTDVAVDYTTVDGSANSGAGNDYIASSGTATINAGDTFTQVSVTVIGDTVVEANEQFQLVVSNLIGDAELDDAIGVGTILTDDPLAQVSIEDNGLLEGDSGLQILTFTINMNVSAADDVTFDITTVDDSAIAGEDYESLITSGLISAGNTFTTVDVNVHGDTDGEDDERFRVLLSNISENAVLRDAEAQGNILNDDAESGWQASQVLDNDEHQAFAPEIELNDAGHAAAIWRIEPTLNGGVYASYYDPASGWTTNRELTSALVNGSSYDITINNNNDVIATWNSSGLHVNHFNPATDWDPPITIDNTLPLFTAAAVDNNDNNQAAIVTFHNVSGFPPPYDDVYFSLFDGTVVTPGWTSPDLLEFEDIHALEPEVVVEENGDMIAVWRSNFVYASHYDQADGTWSLPEAISTIPSDADEPVISVDPNGNAFVAWATWRDPSPTRGFVTRFDATLGEWDNTPFRFNNVNSREVVWPQLDVDEEGNATLIWLEEDGSGDFDIWSRFYSVDNGQWSNARLVNDANLPYRFNLSAYRFDIPRLAISPDGSALVVWTQQIGDEFYIRASERPESDSDWLPPEQISDAGIANVGYPRLDMDEGGNAIVIWQQENPSTGNFEVWTNHFVNRGNEL